MSPSGLQKYVCVYRYIQYIYRCMYVCIHTYILYVCVARGLVAGEGGGVSGVDAVLDRTLSRG